MIDEFAVIIIEPHLELQFIKALIFLRRNC